MVVMVVSTIANMFLTRFQAVLAHVNNLIKVAVGSKRSANRNLKEIVTIECTKTVIFKLLRP